MSRIKNQHGFTLIEILAATFIMAVGFLSLAEMEALSLRQKQFAENGTTATNIIQFVSDRDMAEVKRRYLLNSAAYSTAQGGGTPDTTYCNGSTTSVCSTCPCDPLQAITPTTTNGTTETTCAAIDVQTFDPTKLNFTTSKTQCQTSLTNLINAKRAALFMIKQASTTQTTDPTSGLTILTVSITYAVKSQTQFTNTGLTSLRIRDSLASQAYQVTAHIDTTYSDFIPGWTQVRVPHIP